MSDPIHSIAGKVAEKSLEQHETEPSSARPDSKDVARFEQTMEGRGTDATSVNEAAAGSESGPAPPEQVSLGDKILDGMKRLGESHEAQVEKVNELVEDVDDQPMTMQDAMRLQFELLKLTQQQEVTTKVADKSGQGIQTLLRNQ